MSDRLYSLLPAIYRIRDAERGEPLRALLGIIAEQLEIIEKDIGGLYEDWFIETCEEWVVPYIADLLGVRMLNNIESSGIYSQRAFVANTLSYRRRKGTLLMLEDLAHDVTGWGAHAVTFFELLGWTQHLDHLRYEIAPNPNPRNPNVLNPQAVNRVGTVNLRSLDVVDRLNGPFDQLSHTVDVRPPRQLEGWHNIRNVGMFLWRLQSYPMIGAQPRSSEDYSDGFHFSPLGNPAPLFTNPKRKADDIGPVTEANVPGKIRPLAFSQNPESYYGSDSDKSLAIYRGQKADPKKLIPLEDILCKDLSTWSPPPPGMVGVDVVLGRFAFAPGETPDKGVTVSYHYGFSADIGSGPYDRRAVIDKAYSGDWKVRVAKGQADPRRRNIADTIDDWNQEQQPRAVITIADNATYDENITLDLRGDQHLIIQADNRNRPTVRFRADGGALSVLTITGGAGTGASLTLNGLLVEGGIQIDAQSLCKLELIHSTLVPGRALDKEGKPRMASAASLVVDPDNTQLEVLVQASIVGALRLPENMRTLTVLDSIIDRPEDENEEDNDHFALAQTDTGDTPASLTVIERSTVFGKVHVKTLKRASEVIFAQEIVAQMRQDGCVRYSYVRDLVSITPRRFRCQPDLALRARRRYLQVEELPAIEEEQIRSRMRPDFSSRNYGNPWYGQLSLNTANEIRTGAEDTAEMGVFQQLRQPQREANLCLRLQEYLPYGLEAGIIYVTDEERFQ